MKKTFVYLPAASLLLALANANRASARNPVEAKSAPASTLSKPTMGKPETISGSLFMLIKDQKLVVLQTAGGVSYNFKVTAQTKIKIGENDAQFTDLGAMAIKGVSITFVPMREGNIAKKIQIQP